MTFVNDKEARRTYDPDRGYELRWIPSGCGGGQQFILDGFDGELEFWGRSVGKDGLRPGEGEALGLEPSEGVGFWLLGGLFDRPGLRDVVAEALLTAKLGSGWNYPNTKWFVRFGDGETRGE